VRASKEAWDLKKLAGEQEQRTSYKLRKLKKLLRKVKKFLRKLAFSKNRNNQFSGPRANVIFRARRGGGG
jgi:hypothetical protein